MSSHTSSFRKVRSSGTSAGNPPSLDLDDLTLRQEELRDSLETLLLSHLRALFSIFLWADFQLTRVTIKSSQTAESDTRVAVTHLPDSAKKCRAAYWQLAAQEEAKRKGANIYRMLAS